MSYFTKSTQRDQCLAHYSQSLEYCLLWWEHLGNWLHSLAPLLHLYPGIPHAETLILPRPQTSPFLHPPRTSFPHCPAQSPGAKIQA